MSKHREAKVVAELRKRAAATTKSKQFRIEDYCFDKQISFITDPSRFKTAVCGRRSGKSIACAADLVFTAATQVGDVAYVTVNRRTAKKIIWREILKLNKIYGLGGKPDNTELTLTMPNTSMIHLSGAKDETEADKLRGLSFRKVYIDECFHPNTLVTTSVGEIAIKDLRVGDLVKNPLGYRKITEKSIKYKDKYVLLVYNGRQVKCSLEHPFFTTNGWVPAHELKPGDELVTTDEAMRIMQQPPSRLTQEQKILQQDLQQEVAIHETISHKPSHLHRVQGGIFKTWETKVQILLDKLQRNLSSKVFKPNEQPSDSIKSVENFESNGTQTPHSRRQRHGPIPSGASALECFTRLNLELCNWARKINARLPKKLQSGFSLCTSEVGNRGGWANSQLHVTQSTGPKEGSETGVIRLDSVEIQECRSDESNREGCFYDIGVEGHPSFTVNGALVHNCQNFRPYIQGMIDDIIVPCLTDYNGSLSLIGTPGLVPTGFFYKMSHSKAWSNYHWTMQDNPHIFRKSGVQPLDSIKAEAERRGLSLDSPSIQREWFGNWINDTESRVWQFDPDRNIYVGDVPADAIYVFGVDIGYIDSDAIAVLAYSASAQRVYVVEEYIKDKSDITTLANKVKELQQKYQPVKMVMDAGALGKKIQEEILQRHQVFMHAAEKQRKSEFIVLMNDDLRTSRIQFKPNSRFEQDSFLTQWDWTNPERPVIGREYHSDIDMAVLYAWRECKHFYERDFKAPELSVDQYMVEAHAKEAADMERQKAGGNEFTDVRDWQDLGVDDTIWDD